MACVLLAALGCGALLSAVFPASFPVGAPGGAGGGRFADEAAVVVGGGGVMCKLRLTFKPGNYVWRCSYGFGVLVRDLGEWTPGFCTEF